MRSVMVRFVCAMVYVSTCAVCARADQTSAAAATERPASLVWQASFAFEAANKLTESLSVLGELPQAERTSYMAVYRRAWLLYQLERYDEAVVAYDSAASLV